MNKETRKDKVVFWMMCTISPLYSSSFIASNSQYTIPQKGLLHFIKIKAEGFKPTIKEIQWYLNGTSAGITAQQFEILAAHKAKDDG